MASTLRCSESGECWSWGGGGGIEKAQREWRKTVGRERVGGEREKERDRVGKERLGRESGGSIGEPVCVGERKNE